MLFNIYSSRTYHVMWKCVVRFMKSSPGFQLTCEPCPKLIGGISLVRLRASVVLCWGSYGIQQIALFYYCSKSYCGKNDATKEKWQSIITSRHEGQSIQISRTLNICSSAVTKRIKLWWNWLSWGLPQLISESGNIFERLTKEKNGQKYSKETDTACVGNQTELNMQKETLESLLSPKSKIKKWSFLKTKTLNKKRLV